MTTFDFNALDRTQNMPLIFYIRIFYINRTNSKAASISQLTNLRSLSRSYLRMMTVVYIYARHDIVSCVFLSRLQLIQQFNWRFDYRRTLLESITIGYHSCFYLKHNRDYSTDPSSELLKASLFSRFYKAENLRGKSHVGKVTSPRDFNALGQFLTNLLKIVFLRTPSLSE